MLTHTHRILIGANGWLHPAWQTAYYPDDLPEDWQLGFYSNEFPVVLMPAGYWPTVRGDIQEWLEDSDDELMVLCEIAQEWLSLPVAEALSKISEFIGELSILGAHCIGVLIPVDEQCIDIAAILSKLNSPVPVCVEITDDISQDKLKPIQKVCEQLGFGVCWHGQGEATGLAYGQLAVTRMDTQGMNMRQIREIVETIINTTKLEQSSILIINGCPPDVEVMRNANVILDLI